MMVQLGRYRGVSRPGHGALGWVAQRRGRFYKARFKTEVSAAQWLARSLGVSVSALRRKRRREDGQGQCMSRYRGVVHHSGCWEARGSCGRVLGYFGSEKVALAKVMEVRQKTEKELRKDDFSKRALRSHFKSKHHIFHKYVPGDVQSMYEHEERCARTIFKEDRRDIFGIPSLVLISPLLALLSTLQPTLLPSGASPCLNLYLVP